MQTQIGVYARTTIDGQKLILVRPVRRPDLFLRLCRAFGDRFHRDWQAAVYEDVPTARSGVMRDFGPGWFSKARAALAEQEPAR